MKQIIAGIVTGFLLATSITYAYRIPKPQRITAFDHNGLVILNEVLEQLYDLTNGRFTLNVVTSNPDGTLLGTAGDMLLYNASGTYYLEICAGSNVWRGTTLSDTP